MLKKAYYKLLRGFFVVYLVFYLIAFFPTIVFALPFKDLDDKKFEWARPFIDKMYNLGVVSGKAQDIFAPADPIKRQEFIVMLIKALEEESKVKGKLLPKDFPNQGKIQSWAKEYIAYSIEKGIITGDDFKNFRPEENLKRYEAVIFIVKALGLEKEANSIKILNLTFKDVYTLSFETRKYLQLIVDKKIMSGIDKENFKPYDYITRAQAAKVLNQVVKYTNNTRIFKGKIENLNLSEGNIEILQGNIIKKYNLDKNISIYKEDEKGNLLKIELKDLKKYQDVNYIVKSNNVSYLEVIYSNNIIESELEDYEGKIKAINLQNNYLILEKVDGSISSYIINSDTKCFMNNNVIPVNENLIGKKVKISVSNGKIMRIEVAGENKEVKGILKGIVSNVSPSYIIIENSLSKENETYILSNLIETIKNDKPASINELLGGDMVIASITNGSVTRIIAESAEKTIFGVIKSINFANKVPLISVIDSEGNLKEYEVDSQVKVIKNGITSKLNDLKISDEVTIVIRYNRIVSISAKTVKKEITGTIKEISHTSVNYSKIVIFNEKGEEVNIVITPDTDILKDKKNITVYDLKPDYSIRAIVEGEEAKSVEVFTTQSLLAFRGKIKYIHQDIMVIIAEITNEKGTEVREIHYGTNTLLIKGNRTISLSKFSDYFKEGDDIIIIGKVEGGLFKADVLINLIVQN
ncbi:S-layer homology domain-containing protein [Thermovenabulum sp.]|uniref:S-layer homology domain-containing protein n=3 Tax=Thermovenabulum sp. TaxID=3100335 RepID=UPI003C7B43F5